MNRHTINLQKLVDLTRIGCALFTVKKSSFHGKAIWGTTPPLIRVHQESIVLPCSSVICSPVNVLICKEHSNFINEDRKNFRQNCSDHTKNAWVGCLELLILLSSSKRKIQGSKLLREVHNLISLSHGRLKTQIPKEVEMLEHLSLTFK